MYQIDHVHKVYNTSITEEFLFTIKIKKKNVISSSEWREEKKNGVQNAGELS